MCSSDLNYYPKKITHKKIIYFSSLFYVVHYYYYYFNLIYLFIYLFMAALGLRCCAQAFSSCGERGLLFVAARGLLIAVASLVAEHGL